MKPIVKKFWKTILPKNTWKMIFSASSQLAEHNELAKKGFTSMWWSLSNLKKLGFQPSQIIDVGAYQGEWTKEVAEIFPSSEILMIEAQPEKKNLLSQIAMNNDNITFISSLVGCQDGELKEFTVMKTGSSVFEQNFEGKSSRHKIEIKSSKLDTLIKDWDNGGSVFLKLDVQGYELEVLKGATEMLKNTPVILLESSLLNFNQGAPLISDIFQFMSERNYVLFDICEFHRKSEDSVLNQVDLLFCKENWEIRNKVNFRTEKDRI